ncbi:ABC transporter substrate-binding protein [Aliiglaciecola sp. CAU 1673]|uniref:heme/hemin ABC transporter substrate-binding protein n=1 Tax=Aliiglaciecola sp. CAU 1673 TaxID=3032595 RepID=UPI0023D9E3F3|nr:ABC transporter substrate-binding protein [Aliiglaciecola sp. CAU 1673]MDF2180144.1 ABC transporter substrate-binding protein [Aliiglaciecola sp. CAU 1673]
MDRIYPSIWPLALLFGLLMALPARADLPKLITAGGTLTDIVFALDADQALVATDSSSTSPAQATALPQVGYYRDLSAEGVLSFAPQWLWVLEGGGSENVLQQIERAGVEVTQFAKPRDVAALYALIRDIGERLQRAEQAEDVVASLQSRLQPLKPGQAQKALFVLQASARGVVAAGTETVPQLLLEHAGLQNIISHLGFKTISVEYLALQQPALLIAPSHTVAAAGGKQAFCAQPALRLLEAARHCRLLVMDSLLALGMTTRLPDAIVQLSDFADKHGLPSAAQAHQAQPEDAEEAYAGQG